MSQFGQNTTNQSDRNINIDFKLVELGKMMQEKDATTRKATSKQFSDKFNKRFEDTDEEIRGNLNKYDTQDMKIIDEKIKTVPLHKKPTEEVIVTIRELFYKSLEMLLNKQNPIPFIFSTPDRQFAFAILMIGIGTLLLLFSNLMMSSETKKD